MYFSLLFLLIIPIGYFLWKKYSWKTYIGYLESGDASMNSFKQPEKSKSKYFCYDGGRINLKKHPELKRFHLTTGENDVLVELWDKKEDLYLEEGKSKVAIFEVIDTEYGFKTVVLCLRKVESIIKEPTDNFLEDYMSIKLGVSWDNNRKYKIIPTENLIGVVKYESV